MNADKAFLLGGRVGAAGKLREHEIFSAILGKHFYSLGGRQDEMYSVDDSREIMVVWSTIPSSTGNAKLLVPQIATTARWDPKY